MKRPLIYTLLFMIIGILAGRYLNDIISIAFFVILIFIICMLEFYRNRNKNLSIIINIYPYVIFFIFMLFGIFLINISLQPKDKNLDILVHSGEHLEFSGVASGISYTKTGKQKAVLNIDKVFVNEKSFATNIKVHAILKEGEELKYGQYVKAKGKLELLEGNRNMGGFNEFLYYRTRKIQYKTFPIILEKGNIKWSVGVLNDKIKNKLNYIYDVSLPEREAGIVKSMIIGDRTGLDDYTAELYRITGIYHILAISGLHISIIAYVINSIFGLFWGRKISGILTICILVFYCIFTGSSVSTVRAVVMFSIIIVGYIVNRESDLLNSTAFAAICLLIYEPLYIWDIGFQYSFSAVFGIAICSKAFDRVINRAVFLTKEKFPKFVFILDNILVKNYLSVCVSIFVCTLPVVLYHYYYFLPYSVFANMIVLPTLCVATVSGILIGIIGMFFLEGAIFVSGIFYIIIKVYEWICIFFSSLPLSQILTGQVSIIIILIWCVLVALMIYYINSNKQESKKRKKYFLSTIVLFICATLIAKYYPKNLEIAILDVGQGDCFVISSNKEIYIIDGGGLHSKEYGENTGVSVLLPYLNYKGISYVDKVFITHFDNDHATGIIELLDKKRVGDVYISNKSSSSNEIYEKLNLLQSKYDFPINTISAGNIIQGDNLIFNVLYPFEDSQVDNINNESIVLKLTSDKLIFMFTGDVDSLAEAEILGKTNNLNCDILKLAHHGSKYSNSEEFLREVNPKIAVVSTGRGNVYKHPSKETVERLDENNITLLNTADVGAIIISLDGENIKIKTMLQN